MKKKTRHSTLRKRAEIIDLIIDKYIRIRKQKNFPKKILQQVVSLFFPECEHLGSGYHKEVFFVRSRSYDRVLKISKEKSTKRDWEIYRNLPRSIRNRYFAKIYWSTKYCLLQKYGIQKNVPKATMRKLKGFGKKHGLTDINEKNVCFIDGRLKIIDANVSKRIGW